MMKVPPLSLVGMERLPLPLPFSPELLWRISPMAPSGGPPPSSPSAAAAAAGALSLRVAAAASSALPFSLSSQLPFAYDIKQTIPITLASDPRLWSREDVLTFLQWCEREFDLPSFNTDRFQMNGKALCLLTKTDLELRAPCSGDVIHNALQLLMYPSQSESPLTPQTPSLRMPSLPYKGPWSVQDLHFAATQSNNTTSVTLSPAPSLDGQGSPPEHGGTGTSGPHLSSSSTGSTSSVGSGGGNNSDDSEYDSVGESSERSPINQQSHSPSPPQQTNFGLATSYTTTTSSTNTSGNNCRDPNGPNIVSTTTVSGQISPSTTTSNKSIPSSAFSRGASKTNTTTVSSNGDSTEYNNNGRLLWDFLQQLLNDPSQRYNSFIAWKNVETGIFKIVDPPGLARLWGIQKNHLSMNYDKMSRALRYYYRVNILRKVQGERHCYQFLRNPGELKSIKNISMLRHSPTNTVNTTGGNSSSPSFHDDTDYLDDDMPTDLSMDSERHLKQEEDSPTDLTMDTERHHYHIKEELD